MPNYTIDTGLYDQALKQIKAAYLKGHPVSPLVADTVMPAVEEHAKQLFGMAWHGAIEMHESNKQHRAGLSRQGLQPLDERRLAGLRPADQQRMRERHEQMERQFRERMDKSQKLVDDNNRKIFIALFTNSGVEQSLAEKILDEHILIH